MKKSGRRLDVPKGFRFAGMYSGIKQKKNPDLVLAYSPKPCAAAGMFTRNRFRAAPLVVSQKHLRNSSCRAVVANSGNANACTGKQGLADALLMAELAASELSISTGEVLVASTGMISRPLPRPSLERGIPRLARALKEGDLRSFARGIMTTDTFQKSASAVFSVQGRRVVLAGVAKGAGMIHPNMATMLAFLFTDLRIAKPLLRRALREACARSFNRISIDGDTSTNDCVLCLANGDAGNRILANPTDPGFPKFQEALNGVTLDLARQIVLDGEGATKFVEIRVTGAKRESDAAKVASTIATSNLVKTAMFGCDPNWGRILAAAGRAFVPFDPDRVKLFLGKIQVHPMGKDPVRTRREAARYFRQKSLTVRLDLGGGAREATVLTCDLSLDYVKINSEYST